MLRDKGFGGDSDRATPVPIPNTEVKPVSADGTWVDSPWESRTPPDFSCKGPDFGRAPCRFPAGSRNRRTRGVWPVRGASRILGRSVGSVHALAPCFFVAPSGQVRVSPPTGAQIVAAAAWRFGGSVNWCCNAEVRVVFISATGCRRRRGQRSTFVAGDASASGACVRSRGAHRRSARCGESRVTELGCRDGVPSTRPWQ